MDAHCELILVTHHHLDHAEAAQPWASLGRVHDLGPAVLYPGHGPELRTDPSAVIDYYLAHRGFRERRDGTVELRSNGTAELSA
jgi:glyoxylase-like metal-dependent hydrolase (beta-lactamase superfamily II)